MKLKAFSKGGSKMNSSIYDVAKRAGVSISTVSRVINNSAGVKDNKVIAVREALEYYDYQPSQFGRGLVTGNSGLIGVYSPFSDGDMFQNGFMLETLKGIDSVMKESLYSLLLISERSSYKNNKSARPKFMDYINQKRIDGLIVLSIPSDGRLEASLSEIMDEGFPTGYIGKKFHDKGVNVYAKYENYMFSSIERMYEKGHRRIAFLTLKSRSMINSQIKAQAEKKYEGLRVYNIDMNFNISVEFEFDIIKFMVEEQKTTGIICEFLELALKIQTILNSMGKNIGRDVSIISVEHSKGEGEQILPKIDCYYVPAMEMGRAIAREMIDWLEHKEDRIYSQDFNPEYQDRHSVKCLEM
jgi:LacI family transcriptional regulator